MALINRISRLVKADFHAVLDQIEEPAQLLKQAIREMEDELALAEQRIARAENEQEVLGTRRKSLDEDLAGCDSQLDLCLDSGKEDLARTLVRRKLQTERQSKHLQAAGEANDKYLDEQRAALTENRNTLQDLRQKAALFTERMPGDRGEQAWAGRDVGISDDEVEIALLGELNRRARP